MTPKILWISIYGMLLISHVICSNKKLKRKKIPAHLRERKTSRAHKFVSTRKTTPMFVHHRRRYSNKGFENISTEPGTFIDKTMMIEKFFENRQHPFHLVTFPEKFGKTTNLDMIYRFARIQLNATGNPTLDKRSTDGYRLFSNHTQIGKYRQDIIQDHLAEYPVLYLNMVGFFMGLRESNERMDSMSHILKWCIAEYQVLLDMESTPPNGMHRVENFEFLRKAFNRELSYVDMQNSLYEFSRILGAYFDRKIILLIDDFDYPFNSAVQKSIGYEMIDLLVTMLDRLFHPFEDHRCHVAYALITGTSNTMAAIINAKVPEIIHHRAFENHIFAPFYGITDRELATLMSDRVKMSYVDESIISEYYMGYLIRGTNHLIANTFSITEYFRKNYTCLDPRFSIQSIVTFVDFMKNKHIYELVLQLVFLNVVEVELTPGLGLEQMNKLWQVERSSTDNCYDIDAEIFFSFLFENGYLSYTERNNLYRVPNEEISNGLKYFTTIFYDSMYRKTKIHEWDDKYTLKSIFETGLVTGEMIRDLHRCLKNMLVSADGFNITEGLELLHYQSLVYYTARKYIGVGNVRVQSAFYFDESFEQPVYIVKISLQSIMDLYIGLTRDEYVEKILEHVYRYANQLETGTRAMMIKYIGISVKEGAPKVTYNYSGSIGVENYHTLLTTTTPASTTKKKRKNYTRSTAMTYAKFPRLPKKMTGLFWFGGGTPLKRGYTAIEGLY